MLFSTRRRFRPARRRSKVLGAPFQRFYGPGANFFAIFCSASWKNAKICIISVLGGTPIMNLSRKIACLGVLIAGDILTLLFVFLAGFFLRDRVLASLPDFQ